MANPLLLFFLRSHPAGGQRTSGPGPRAGFPEEPPATDVLFLVLRRMRTPLILSILVFGTSVLGLVLIPGQDENGNPATITVFDAFYFISYTATTIGFGEIVPFTAAQRMWVNGTIFASVITWAYAFGTVLTLVQDPSFQEALRVQHFRRRVRAISEPFTIVAGFGLAGRQVCEEYDAAGHRFVVIDSDMKRLDLLVGSRIRVDAPRLHADSRAPLTLTLAGLGLPNCVRVLALTSDDEANLAITMTVTMLRPDVEVIARCVARIVTERMADFSPAAIINPADRFGDYLLLALRRPHVYQLVTWLMSAEGTPLPAAPERLAEGSWVVCGAGGYARHISRVLNEAGVRATVADPAAGHPDVTGAAGFLAATPDDIVNMALAEHVRCRDENVFIAVRQRNDASTATLRAIGVDSVFIPTDLIATETLARTVTPVFWDFVLHAFSQDDAWGTEQLNRIKRACGTAAPRREMVIVDQLQAPAVTRWLTGHPLTLGDLLRHPGNRDQRLHLVPLALVRGEKSTPLPPPGTMLRIGDKVLLAGRAEAHRTLDEALHYDSVIRYLATGEHLPSTWVWRWLVLRRRARAQRREARQRRRGT